MALCAGQRAALTSGQVQPQQRRKARAPCRPSRRSRRPRRCRQAWLHAGLRCASSPACSSTSGRSIRCSPRPRRGPRWRRWRRETAPSPAPLRPPSCAGRESSSMCSMPSWKSRCRRTRAICGRSCSPAPPNSSASTCPRTRWSTSPSRRRGATGPRIASPSSPMPSCGGSPSAARRCCPRRTACVSTSRIGFGSAGAPLMARTSRAASLRRA